MWMMNNHTPYVCLFLLWTILLDCFHMCVFFIQYSFYAQIANGMFHPQAFLYYKIMIVAHIGRWLRFILCSEWIKTFIP